MPLTDAVELFPALDGAWSAKQLASSQVDTHHPSNRLHTAPARLLADCLAASGWLDWLVVDVRSATQRRAAQYWHRRLY